MRHLILLLLVALTPNLQAADDDAPTSKSKASPTPHHRQRKTTHRYPESTPSSSPKKQPFQDPEDEPAPKKSRPTPEPTASEDAEESPTPKPTPTPSPSPARKSNFAENASLDPGELTAFDAQPPRVQKLITGALALTRQDLTYTFGSSDPANGGLDCSGFIYHVLREEGLDEVPRDASGQYVWLRKAGTFRAVVSLQDDSFELNELRPGDLLFWTGTYSSKKDPPVTHTMIYLGRETKTGQRVMVGSSDGRSYEGQRRWGVSVFDFKMPGPASVQKGVDFIGYAHLPELAKAAASPPPTAEPSATPEPTETPTATPEPTATPKATPHRRKRAKRPS